MASIAAAFRIVTPRTAAVADRAAARTFFTSSASRMVRPPLNAHFFSTAPTKAPKRAPYSSHNFRSRFFHSSRARRTNGAAAEEPLTLGQRMKKLSREYGWSAVGVYFMLSALDFPFCYLLVRTLGTDRIGEWEHAVVSHVAPIIPQSVKDSWYGMKAFIRKQELKWTGDDDVSDAVDMASWDLTEAGQAEQQELSTGKVASLGTQLALAYAIHKSFIFIRVPLTAAVTPKVVKVLRGWGWDIGKRTTKAAKAAKREAIVNKK